MTAMKEAYKSCSILHRDVSTGNILIVDKPEEGGFVGFIHDFDYSAMTLNPPLKTDSQKDTTDSEEDESNVDEDNADLKERTVSTHL